MGGAELRAWDAADRYLLDYAAAEFPDALAGEVAVIDDTHGALALGAAALGAAGVRVHQDSIVGQRALAANAAAAGLPAGTQHPLDEVVTPATTLVLLRMPRALERLAAVAQAVAASAGPERGDARGQPHQAHDADAERGARAELRPDRRVARAGQVAHHRRARARAGLPREAEARARRGHRGGRPARSVRGGEPRHRHPRPARHLRLAAAVSSAPSTSPAAPASSRSSWPGARPTRACWRATCRRWPSSRPGSPRRPTGSPSRPATTTASRPSRMRAPT